MKLLTQFLLLSFILFTFSCENEEPAPSPEINFTETEQTQLDLLNANLSPIDPSPLRISDAALSGLDRIAEKKIVGLGEATHGTKEFFQMKHRIFRYLVEKHGFKAFLFEMDFAEALIFEDWIQGKRTDDLAQLMREKMIFWTWRTKEVQELFTWMRDYNVGKEEKDRIHLYGVDSQYTRYNRDLLIERLIKIDPELGDSLRWINPRIKDIHDLYPNKDQSIADNIEEGVERTFALLDRERERIIELSSETEYLWLQQLARHMEQVTTYLYQYYFFSNFDLRDRYMAENTQWLADQLGTEAKVVLWAHNGHVAKDQFYGTAPSQGGHLHVALQDEYQVVGFGFTKGTFTAFGSNRLSTKRIDEDPKRASYNFLFHHASSPAFFVDMKALGYTPLRDWFSRSKEFLSLGSTFNPPAIQYYNLIPLWDRFDVIVYFDETKASELL